MDQATELDLTWQFAYISKINLRPPSDDRFKLERQVKTAKETSSNFSRRL
jgi:hypothetical protein